MVDNKPKIVFLNQMAGPLFREMAEDISHIWSPSLLYTGHPHSINHGGSQSLVIVKAPLYYKSNMFKRIVSWLYYFIGAFFTTLRQPKESLLFFGSNPPFLGLLGLLFKLIRGQRYVVLIYDVYPDILVKLGRLKKGMIVNGWNLLNRFVFEHSSMVITIGEFMAKNLEKKFNSLKTNPKKVIYIPCWTDIKFIKPIPKSSNWFAASYGLIDKVTILYSGNMGYSHDIETILELAKQFKNEQKVHFLFIGEGVKWKLVEKTIHEEQLDNITLLPFQPENVLPYSLSAGDIGIISYQEGTETYMVPSKAYYYMAAGLALFIIADKENELTSMVAEHKCGMYIKRGNNASMIDAMYKLVNNSALLEQYKSSARNTAENFYSRRNTQLYEKAIREYCSL